MRRLGIFVLFAAVSLQSCGDLIARAIADPKGTGQAAATAAGASLASSLVGSDTIQAVAQMEETLSNLRRLAEDHPDALNAVDIESLTNHFSTLLDENASAGEGGVYAHNGFIPDNKIKGDNRRFGGFHVVGMDPEASGQLHFGKGKDQVPKKRTKFVRSRGLTPLSEGVVIIGASHDVRPYYAGPNVAFNKATIGNSQSSDPFGWRVKKSMPGSSSLSSLPLFDDVIANIQATKPQEPQVAD